MWPDPVSNLGPLTYTSGALSTALRGPAVEIDWPFSEPITCTILILINVPALINTPYVFSENNVILTYIDGWMDHLRFYVLFNSISVISGRCFDDNERLCAMELLLRMRRFHLE